MKLQRVMVDFGVDEAFRKAQKKLQEHYGISMGYTALRNMTLKHAEEAKHYEETSKMASKLPKESQILSETDGSMIPILEHPVSVEGKEPGSTDKRKNKQCVYKEVKLSMARPIKVGDKIRANIKFEATVGDKIEAGQRIKHCLESVGATQKTSLHVVGDGAQWIEEQYRQVTKGKCHYLIDFYHLMEYLNPAGESYIHKKNPDTEFNRQENNQDKHDWIEASLVKIKKSQIQEVVEELRPYVEPAYYVEKPIQKFVTYVDNRLGQFDYRAAIAADLPIGSGEIESANKSLIQQRLKIPGAWWKMHNADCMIGLRAMVANGHWENYWQDRAIQMRLH